MYLLFGKFSGLYCFAIIYIIYNTYIGYNTAFIKAEVSISQEAHKEITAETDVQLPGVSFFFAFCFLIFKEEN